MICPECTAEDRPGIERCADRGVPLVAALPAEDHDAPELVPACEIHDPADLLAVESALEGAGIPFELDDESAVPGASLAGLDPVGRVAVVLVPKHRLQEARELLGEEGDDEEEDDEDDDWDDDEEDEEDWGDEDEEDEDDEEWDDEDEDDEDEDGGEDDFDGDGDR
jgi:hypothetical protein